MTLKQISPGKNGEFQLADALNRKASEHKVETVGFKGERFDCGTKTGFVKATHQMAKLRGLI